VASVAGCDYKTVARLVAAREADGVGCQTGSGGGRWMDPFMAKIDELVDRSGARIGATRRIAPVWR